MEKVMAFGALIIGDEILSGRRSDKHLAHLIEALGQRGLRLTWARYIGDDRGELTRILRETSAGDDAVFSFGGIGATPDDHTRQAAAAAFDRELMLHPEAEKLIRERFGSDITPHRLQMGEFPRGSAIIPNTYNQIPGFSLARHFFVPGFPVMAWPMVDWVLERHFKHLYHSEDYTEQAIIIQDGHEGGLIDLMERITAAYPGAGLFSLPSVAENGHPRSVELGMKGPVEDVGAAMAEIKAEVSARGLQWQDKF